MFIFKDEIHIKLNQNWTKEESEAEKKAKDENKFLVCSLCQKIEMWICFAIVCHIFFPSYK